MKAPSPLQLSRRDVLRVGALSAAGLAVSAASRPLVAQEPELMSEFVFRLDAALDPVLGVDVTPNGLLQIVYVRSGTVTGPQINGEILPGGGDWVRTRPDGVGVLDARAVLRLDDNQMVYMTYAGYGTVAADVLGRIMDGEEVDPAEYYFRLTPRFETASEQYAWLNQSVFVGTGVLGSRLASISYDIYRIL